MKPQELRVGNIVEVNHYGYGDMFASVTSINDVGDLCLHLLDERFTKEEYECTMNEITPIPITEELLLNNGFDRWGEIFYKDGFECARDGDKWCMSCNCFEYYLARLNGIHQLQNAYYLVTGKELEIKV